MAKKAKPPESVAGSYTPNPHNVLDSNAFTGASYRAKAMIHEFMRQHNGRNNGHLHACYSWLSERGWLSKEAISEAVKELELRGLILKTKQGGLDLGPSLYALTWLRITNFSGLDIQQKAYWPGAWTNCEIPPKQSVRRVKKRSALPDSRGSTDPAAGAEDWPTDPVTGATKADFHNPTAPVAGDNECCQFPGEKDWAWKTWKAPRNGRPRHSPNSMLCIRLVIDNDRGETRRAA